MGYYTVYTLRIIEDDDKNDYLERMGAIEETENVDHMWQIEERYQTMFNDSVKWYDHTDNMIEYSKEYPDILFELNGEGEESGDIWRSYFKNGLFYSERPQIIFDEYDETKLK